MTNFRKIITGATSAFLISASAASAGSCGYDYCWGAVAIGPYGAWGYSYGQWSEQNAIDVAQSECGYDCTTTVRTFYNTCGAIAQADNGAWGFGWAGSQEIAESEAMSYCMDGGYNCQVRVWSCSQ